MANTVVHFHSMSNRTTHKVLVEHCIHANALFSASTTIPHCFHYTSLFLFYDHQDDDQLHHGQICSWVSEQLAHQLP